MKINKYEQDMEKVSNLMSTSRLDEAETLLNRLLQKADSEQKIVVLNNLASIAQLRDDPEQALSVLEPLLEAEPPVESPYTLGLAAQLYARLGQKDEALRFLKQAEKVFKKKLPLLREMGLNPYSWCEYTVQLMRAALALGDHKMVIDLYKRYERYHVRWENRFYAGIAYFNLKRYKQAASIWDPLKKVGDFINPMQRIAFLMERGAIPHFVLSDKLPEWGKLIEKFKDSAEDDEKQEVILQDGMIRLVLLDTLFGDHPENDMEKTTINMLVKYGGEWGSELALLFLESALVSKEVKLDALMALVQKGVYKEGEDVSIWIDGKETVVRVEMKQVSMEADQNLDQLCDEALVLRNEGRIDEAIALLEPVHGKDKFYPRAMLTLANLYRNKKEWDPALKILLVLTETFSEEPLFLINLAGLYVEKGDFDEALKCIAQAELLSMEGTMRGRLDYIRGLAEQRLTPEEFTDQVKENYFFEVEEELRLEVEEKKFTPESPLMRGLKNMPNEWLQNICLIHGIDLCRLRSEREKAITAYLTSPEDLKEIVKELTQPEEDLLEYLLDKGGWAPLSSVSRKFGKMEGDGYYWDKNEPQSTTGMLWSKGLVVVGKAIVNNRLIKIVAIPADLRVLVEDIFSS